MALLEDTITVAHGETLDVSRDVPLDYPAPGELLPGEAQPSPLTDGSVFDLSFKPARDDAQFAVLRFSTRYTTAPLLSKGEFFPEDHKLTLSLQATDAQIAQIPAGTYIGDLIHERPRTGALGNERRRVAILTLVIIGGTA